jgi:GntR family transcriptional regulator/MocR family aminotransferase
LIETFEKVLAAFVQGVPTNTQAVVAEFIEEGYFATHVRRMRRIYEERHDALHDAARRRLSGLLDVARSESGLHTIGHLRASMSEIAVARAAAERGIVVSPIARFSMEPTGVTGLVLGFGGVRPPEINSGIAELSKVLSQLDKTRSSPARVPRSGPTAAPRRRIGMAAR